MKIAVTGALGHIGSRLIRELPAMFPEAQIVLIDDLSTQRYCSLFNLPGDRTVSFSGSGCPSCGSHLDFRGRCRGRAFGGDHRCDQQLSE